MLRNGKRVRDAEANGHPNKKNKTEDEREEEPADDSKDQNYQPSGGSEDEEEYINNRIQEHVSSSGTINSEEVSRLLRKINQVTKKLETQGTLSDEVELIRGLAAELQFRLNKPIWGKHKNDVVVHNADIPALPQPLEQFLNSWLIKYDDTPLKKQEETSERSSDDLIPRTPEPKKKEETLIQETPKKLKLTTSVVKCEIVTDMFACGAALKKCCVELPEIDMKIFSNVHRIMRQLDVDMTTEEMSQQLQDRLLTSLVIAKRSLGFIQQDSQLHILSGARNCEVDLIWRDQYGCHVRKGTLRHGIFEKRFELTYNKQDYLNNDDSDDNNNENNDENDNNDYRQRKNNKDNSSSRNNKGYKGKEIGVLHRPQAPQEIS